MIVIAYSNDSICGSASRALNDINQLCKLHSGITTISIGSCKQFPGVEFTLTFASEEDETAFRLKYDGNFTF